MKRKLFFWLSLALVASLTLQCKNETDDSSDTTSVEQVEPVTPSSQPEADAPPSSSERSQVEVILLYTSSNFSASGNDPAWSLEIRPREAIVFSDQSGEISMPYVKPTATPTGDPVFRYRTQNNKTEMQVSIYTGMECTDAATGETYQNQVEVVIDGKTYNGCGKLAD